MGGKKSIYFIYWKPVWGKLNTWTEVLEIGWIIWHFGRNTRSFSYQELDGKINNALMSVDENEASGSSQLAQFSKKTGNRTSQLAWIVTASTSKANWLALHMLFVYWAQKLYKCETDKLWCYGGCVLDYFLARCTPTLWQQDSKLCAKLTKLN